MSIIYIMKLQYSNVTHDSLILCLEIDGYIFVSEVTFAI